MGEETSADGGGDTKPDANNNNDNSHGRQQKRGHGSKNKKNKNNTSAGDAEAKKFNKKNKNNTSAGDAEAKKFNKKNKNNTSAGDAEAKKFTGKTEGMGVFTSQIGKDRTLYTESKKSVEVYAAQHYDDRETTHVHGHTLHTMGDAVVESTPPVDNGPAEDDVVVDDDPSDVVHEW